MTFDEEPPGTFEICPVCYWEDDDTQFKDPMYTGGANTVSLEEARSNYRKYGASSLAVKEYVRPPLTQEKPD